MATILLVLVLGLTLQGVESYSILQLKALQKDFKDVINHVQNNGMIEDGYVIAVLDSLREAVTLYCKSKTLKEAASDRPATSVPAIPTKKYVLAEPKDDEVEENWILPAVECEKQTVLEAERLESIAAQHRALSHKISVSTDEEIAKALQQQEFEKDGKHVPETLQSDYLAKVVRSLKEKKDEKAAMEESDRNLALEIAESETAAQEEANRHSSRPTKEVKGQQELNDLALAQTLQLVLDEEEKELEQQRLLEERRRRIEAGRRREEFPDSRIHSANHNDLRSTSLRRPDVLSDERQLEERRRFEAQRRQESMSNDEAIARVLHESLNDETHHPVSRMTSANRNDLGSTSFRRPDVVPDEWNRASLSRYDSLNSPIIRSNSERFPYEVTFEVVEDHDRRPFGESMRRQYSDPELLERTRSQAELDWEGEARLLRELHGRENPVIVEYADRGSRGSSRQAVSVA